MHALISMALGLVLLAATAGPVLAGAGAAAPLPDDAGRLAAQGSERPQADPPPSAPEAGEAGPGLTAAVWPALPGQDDSAFADAVSLWLDDREAEGLGALSALARSGNAAARVLLALIDKSPELQGPWLAQLSREERVALMRAPGGLSGRSWMHAAADSTPLARLWLALWDVEAPPDLVLDFAAAGEARAAREAGLTLSARERSGFARIAAEPGFPPALRFLAWQEWGDEGAVAAERAALAPGDPQRAMGDAGAAPGPADLAAWLLSAPEALPVAAFCNARCAETAPACALAVVEALGGHRAVLALGSPSERLIPAETFTASRRGEAALLRRVLLSVDARGRRLQLALAQSRDACSASALEAEAQGYLPRRN